MVDTNKKLTELEKGVSVNEIGIEKITIFLSQNTANLQDTKNQMNALIERWDKSIDNFTTEIRNLRENALLSDGRAIKLRDDILGETDKRYASKGVQKILLGILSTVGTFVILAILNNTFKR